MADKMTQVGGALRSFIDLLEPADEILVITFSSHVSVAQEFTSDRERLGEVFSRLQPGDGTALYDAAIQAIERVAANPAESKAVVIVSDGMDTASTASFEQLREIARRSEVPVFSLALSSGPGLRSVLRPPGGIGRGPIGGPGRGPGRGWPPGGPGGWPPGGGGTGGWPGGGKGGPVRVAEPHFDARPLLDLADETGGRATILKGLEHERHRAARLQEAVESIAVTLRHRYLVGYEPASGKRGWRKIKVEVDRPSVSVQARKGYYTEG